MVPIIYGAIDKFYLYGEHDGDVYATGGEVEVHLEPRSLYDDVKVYPLNKLDRTATLQSIKKFIYEEEAKYGHFAMSYIYCIRCIYTIYIYTYMEYIYI